MNLNDILSQTKGQANSPMMQGPTQPPVQDKDVLVSSGLKQISNIINHLIQMLQTDDQQDPSSTSPLQ